MTTIHVKEEIWKQLNQLKEPGESMNDVVARILKLSLPILKNSSSQRKEITDSTFSSLLDDFIDVISSERLEKVIDGSRKSFSKGVE